MKRYLISFFICLTLLPFPVVGDTVGHDLERHWSAPYLLELIRKDIFGGYEDGSLRPDNPITVAEFVTVMNVRNVTR